MSRDADFNLSTKQLLSKRAGNHCSFPDCYVPTDGPSDEGADKTSHTGMACHIVAASDGPAARRVGNLSLDELKSPLNGIWMCYTHGKLIDTDECTYSVELLKTWKSIAELRASIAQKYGWRKEFDPRDFSNLLLPEHRAELSELSHINFQV